jgi:hypothetical protein
MAWLRLRFCATVADEARRGDGAAVELGGVALAGGAGLVAKEELDTSVRVSFKCALRSAAAAAAAADVSDSLTRSRLLLVFLGSEAADDFLELFFLPGDLAWHNTQSHLPRGT